MHLLKSHALLFILWKIRAAPWVRHAGYDKLVFRPDRSSASNGDNETSAVSDLEATSRAHSHDVWKRSVELDESVVFLKVYGQKGIMMPMQRLNDWPFSKKVFREQSSAPL